MKKNSGFAAVLSFVLPGVGQIYNGAFLRGIFWLVVTPGLWLWSAGWFGWVCHVVSAYTAYRYAERANERKFGTAAMTGFTTRARIV